MARHILCSIRLLLLCLGLLLSLLLHKGPLDQCLQWQIAQLLQVLLNHFAETTFSNLLQLHPLQQQQRVCNRHNCKGQLASSGNHQLAVFLLTQPYFVKHLNLKMQLQGMSLVLAQVACTYCSAQDLRVLPLLPSPLAYSFLHNLLFQGPHILPHLQNSQQGVI